MELKEAIARVQLGEGAPDGKPFPAQFKVKCVNCGSEKAVRRDVFVNRVEKAYATKDENGESGTLKVLLTSYWCKKCQKAHSKNIIGGVATTTSGSTQVITDIDEE